MKFSFTSALVLASLLFILASCGKKDADHGHADGTADHDHGDGKEHGGDHIYACSMHPEVTSDMPGSCSKCGMKLEHTDGATADGKTYQMKLATSPTQLVAGKPSLFAFTPISDGTPNTPVPLAVVHEKKIHTIIVSKDLAEFYHEHPEYTAKGSYDLAYTFKQGGNYVVFEDYTPEGSTHQLGRQEISVAGPKRAAVKFSKDVMKWNKDGYEVTLSFDKALKVAQPLMVQVEVKRNGKAVTDLENYLGALGHMVIISEDTQQYLHVHPMDSPDKGPKISFHSGFEKAGLYRVFLQFNHGGGIRTADFTINVAQ